MINNVRNTVLSIISKDNRGYITPEEFNLFAKQAQMEIFEKYIYDYSIALNKQNARQHGIGYAGILAKLEEDLDKFRTTATLAYSAPNFVMPTNVYKSEMLIYNGTTEIEKTKNILGALASLDVAPSTTYPVYTQAGANVKVYPLTIVSLVTLDYLRTPLDPKWTYASLTGGEPIFNQSAADYQDFELSADEEPNLVVKILQYAGVSIKSEDVVQYAKSEEIQNKQEKLL